MKMTMKKSTLMSIRRQTFHLPTAVVYHVKDISNKTLYTFTFCKCSRSTVSQLKCAETGRLLQRWIIFSRKALNCTLSTWNILFSVLFFAVGWLFMAEINCGRDIATVLSDLCQQSYSYVLSVSTILHLRFEVVVLNALEKAVKLRICCSGYKGLCWCL